MRGEKWAPSLIRKRSLVQYNLELELHGDAGEPELALA
jgi:hypothetical protein